MSCAQAHLFRKSSKNPDNPQPIALRLIPVNFSTRLILSPFYPSFARPSPMAE